MAGFITDYLTLYKNKSFTYIPPTTPSDLMESTSFTLDFMTRKFLQIDIDPTEDFEIVIRILTSYRYVHITFFTLKQLFSLMGNNLSFILNTPVKYKWIIFLGTEILKWYSMVYEDENVLEVESKYWEGWRVILNRSDLICLRYSEGTILETIHWTGAYTHSLATNQVREYINYLDEKIRQMQSPPVNAEEMLIFVKKEHDYRVIQTGPIATRQIQLFAAAHVAHLLQSFTWFKNCSKRYLYLM